MSNIDQIAWKHSRIISALLLGKWIEQMLIGNDDCFYSSDADAMVLAERRDE